MRQPALSQLWRRPVRRSWPLTEKRGKRLPTARTCQASTLPDIDAFIQQCCRIATIPRRKKNSAIVGSVPAPKNLNVQIADFLAQGIAVQAEQIGGADLVAPGSSQSRR